MKGESNMGGQKYLCATGTTPKHQLSEIEGRFMALGVTSFNVEPVMSVLIIMGNHNKAEVDIGIDIFAEQIKG